MEISSVENIKELGPKGKFRIRGKFSSNINQEMTFNLPLSFPTTSIKCKVYEARADEEVEIICKVQKGFKLVKSFVIEKRMIKRRFKEMVLVKSKSFNLGSESLACENYNIKKYERAKGKQKLNLSFLQLSKFRPQGRKFGFFMGLTRKNNEEFKSMRFSVKVKVRSSSNLRRLDEDLLVLDDIIIACDVISSTSTAGGLNCQSESEASGTPVGMEIDPDNLEVAGLPDNADPSVLNNAVDYSNENNLKKVDELPIVTIDSIESSNCEVNGEYTIKGSFEDGTLEEASDVEIPFGSPDSSGLCDIKVNGKEVTMECNNKEKFDKSSILFEQTVIQDSKGKEIFILSNYTNQKSFGCGISVKSDSPISNKNTAYNQPIMKTGSNGLSGGTIAAIIICSIIALAIIAGIIILAKNGKFSSKPPVDQTFGNNSTLNKFTIEPNPNEI